MNIAVMYSGVGGGNGADYVADFLVNGFREVGADVCTIGKFGGYDAKTVNIPDVDLIVHSSGFNLTPSLINRLQQTAPVAMWTHNDEIGWWKSLIAPVSKLVNAHYSYTKAHTYGNHVRYMPLAADNRQYFPMYDKYEDNKVYDVALIGAKRQWRFDFTEELGKRFPRHFFSYTMSLGSSKINDVYNHTKVVVAPVQDCDEDAPASAWGCPCRTFDVPASRCCQIQVNRGGLNDVYPGCIKIAPIEDVMEAIEVWEKQIHYLIDHSNYRADVAEFDYLHTINNHLYKHRAEQFIREVI